MNNYKEYPQINFSDFTEKRGRLTVVDFKKDLPFEINRVFWITNVGSEETRGNHAHRTCYEVVIVVSGSFKVKLSTDGKNFSEYTLDDPTKGLIIAPYVWCQLYEFSSNSVCLCLASEEYISTGYIHTLDEFALEVCK